MSSLSLKIYNFTCITIKFCNPFLKGLWLFDLSYENKFNTYNKNSLYIFYV